MPSAPILLSLRKQRLDSAGRNEGPLPQSQSGPESSLVVAIIGIAVAVASCASLDSPPTIAVAANFREAAEEIGTAFRAASGQSVRFSFGSTGQLLVQVAQGAPFDAFLAADQRRPRMAIDDGHAVAGSQFTYATGRLVLFSEDRDLVQGPQTLVKGGYARLSIAEPALAPYGAAAIEVLQELGALDSVRPKMVRGMNVAQAYQFVRTGNADLGLVALSQVVGYTGGSRWVVPCDLHSPIKQDAVLLNRGAENPVAQAFLAFLEGPEAATVLRKFGYSASN